MGSCDGFGHAQLSGYVESIYEHAVKVLSHEWKLYAYDKWMFYDAVLLI